jgi:hypothetical protein
VIDVKEARAEIEALRREAAAYGYSLSGNLLDMRKAMEQIRAERAGRPPCYKRMYDGTAAECRVCEIAGDCNPGLARDLRNVPMGRTTCKTCEVGYLTVELMDLDGEVRNYGCTTDGCYNTLLDQTAWDTEETPKRIDPKSIDPEHPQGAERMAVLIDVRRPTDKRRRGKSDSEIDNDILNLCDQKCCFTRTEIANGIKRASNKRVLVRIKELLRLGLLDGNGDTGYSPNREAIARYRGQEDDSAG